MIHYKRLSYSSLDDLNLIDRSDYSSTWCVVKNGSIIQEKREFNHPGFSITHWTKILSEFADGIKKGSLLLFGAFDKELLVGLSGLETSIQYGADKNMFNFGPMWICKKYRRQGVGTNLMRLVKQEAKNLNISVLYVSATPVPGTIDFYLNEGCQLLHVPDPELFASEPEDIHMQLHL